MSEYCKPSSHGKGTLTSMRHKVGSCYSDFLDTFPVNERNFLQFIFPINKAINTSMLLNLQADKNSLQIETDVHDI